MTDPESALLIPVEPKTAADYTTRTAKSAMELGRRLSAPINTIEEIAVQTTVPIPFEPTKAELTSSLHYAHGASEIAVMLTVNVTLRDDIGAQLATIAVVTSSRWQSRPVVYDDWDAVEVFALTFGVLEPATAAARVMQASLEVLGVVVKVRVSDTHTHNTDEVVRVADMPPMDAANASPLNPFALIGVAGDEAIQWEDLDFPASSAEPWVRAHFKPVEADKWVDAGFDLEEATEWRTFDPDEAADWLDADFSAEDAAQWQTVAVRPDQAVDFIHYGYDPDDVDSTWIAISDMHVLLGVIEGVAEMETWISALDSHVMMGAPDVKSFVEAGISPDDLQGVPESLTCGEAIRFLANGSGESDKEFDHDEYEGDWIGSDVATPWVEDVLYDENDESENDDREE